MKWRNSGLGRGGEEKTRSWRIPVVWGLAEGVAGLVMKKNGAGVLAEVQEVTGAEGAWLGR